MNLTEQVRWEILPPAPDEYLHASAAPPLIAQLLYNRGIPPGEIELFLTADHRLEGNPFLLPDMPQAVSRIYKALLSKEKIAIYGDFDVDGVTATAILVKGLSWLGGKVTPYIANRFDEGHGLKFAAIEKLHSQGIGLIVTVDCGITNLAEAKQAQEIGMDIIITDHHIPSASLPQAMAVIDAKRKESRYPHPDLAGAGTAFKLLQALFHKDSRGKRLTELLDLVALGTVADMVPLVGENRYLVKEGLRILNNTHRTGLLEMIRLAGLKPGKLDAESISWTLGPRLNAAGRMEHANTSYQLLTTHSPEEARLLATELEEKNAERQRLTSEVLNKVKENIATKIHLPLLIAGDESYHVGVIGLVAGRLVNEFYKPAIILNIGSELCQGSTRSIPEFNMVTALEQCRDLLTSFGGHPLAAGFTVARQNLTQLEERLTSLAMEQLAQLDLPPKLVIDAEIPLPTLGGDTFNLIQKLSPFGQRNPQPTFLSRRVEVAECRNFGNQSKYLKLKLKQGDTTWQAVDFNSQKAPEETPRYIDVVYSIEKNYWNGEEVLRLNLRDSAPSQFRS
jgi:single-stranded-DNA-specific exonuclease